MMNTLGFIFLGGLGDTRRLTLPANEQTCAHKGLSKRCMKYIVNISNALKNLENERMVEVSRLENEEHQSTGAPAFDSETTT